MVGNCFGCKMITVSASSPLLLLAVTASKYLPHAFGVHFVTNSLICSRLVFPRRPKSSALICSGGLLLLEMAKQMLSSSSPETLGYSSVTTLNIRNIAERVESP